MVCYVTDRLEFSLSGPPILPVLLLEKQNRIGNRYTIEPIARLVSCRRCFGSLLCEFSASQPSRVFLCCGRNPSVQSIFPIGTHAIRRRVKLDSSQKCCTDEKPDATTVGFKIDDRPSFDQID